MFKTEPEHLDDPNKGIKPIGESAGYFGDDQLATVDISQSRDGSKGQYIRLVCPDSLDR